MPSAFERYCWCFCGLTFTIMIFFRSKQNNAHLLKVGSEKTAVFCHMTSLGVCGGGGWTLAIKVNGAQVQTRFFVLPVLHLPLGRFKRGVRHPCIFQMPLFCILICFTGSPNTLRRFHILKCLIRSFFY